MYPVCERNYIQEYLTKQSWDLVGTVEEEVGAIIFLVAALDESNANKGWGMCRNGP